MDEGKKEFLQLYLLPIITGDDDIIWAVEDVKQIDGLIDWALDVRKDFTENKKRFDNGEMLEGDCIDLSYGDEEDDEDE